jgi:hypothetical protein
VKIEDVGDLDLDRFGKRIVDVVFVHTLI